MARGQDAFCQAQSELRRSYKDMKDYNEKKNSDDPMARADADAAKSRADKTLSDFKATSRRSSAPAAHALRREGRPSRSKTRPKAVTTRSTAARSARTGPRTRKKGEGADEPRTTRGEPVREDDVSPVTDDAETPWSATRGRTSLKHGGGAGRRGRRVAELAPAARGMNIRSPSRTLRARRGRAVLQLQSSVR